MNSLLVIVVLAVLSQASGFVASFGVRRSSSLRMADLETGEFEVRICVYVVLYTCDRPTVYNS